MSTTNARLLETAERRAFVLELRKAGADYRTIAAKAIERFTREKLPSGWDERYAYKDVARELARLNEERTEATYEIRRLELERLDKLTMVFFPKALQGDYAAADRVVKFMEQRRKYIAGLEVPKQYEDALQREIIEMVKAGEATPDEIREAFPVQADEWLKDVVILINAHERIDS